jgi:type VII secretion protein EccE
MKHRTVQFAVVLAVLGCGLVGWTACGHVGAGAGLALGLILFAIPWRGQPLWSWLGRYLRRNRPIPLSEPVTVANDRSAGGVRYQDGVAIACLQLLGKAYVPTIFTGSTAAATRNTIDVSELLPAMHQSLGLTIESLSVVISGSRRRSTGDYPRVYDTLIGTPPCAGQRETWLMIRLRAVENAEALQWRATAGTAALAAAQRIAASLRCKGVRAKVATATDMVELERRLGRIALQSHNQRWRTARSDAGWLTTYAYQPRDISAEALGAAWSLRADGIIQNITLFPDGTATATITVRSAQPPTAPPSVILKTLPGEQATAVAANLGGPRPKLHGVTRGSVPAALVLPIGPSGVLLGKINAGDRLLLPLGDPGEFSRIHIAAEDSVAKRIIIRTAGAGDRITVHTRDMQRWASVRMPHVAVSDLPRPTSGTTVSVVDGSVAPAPRPNTVISVGRPGETQRGPADVVVEQIGPATVEVTAAGQVYVVDLELFRTENRYVSSGPTSMRSEEPELAD